MQMVESRLGCQVQYIFTFDKGMLGEGCIKLIEDRKFENKDILFVSALRPSMCDVLFNDLSMITKPVGKTNDGRVIEAAETSYELYV